MKIIKQSDPNSTNLAIEILKQGGLIIYATETCYGAGVDASNPQAISKLLDFKKRPPGKAISVACDSIEMASKYVEINQTAKNIYKEFLPGPVTVISKSKEILDSRLSSEKQTQGIRIPDYPFLLDLIKQFGKPITSTSANLAGDKNPYKIEDILNNLSNKREGLIDLIIDAGELPKNLPSTVIDTTTDDLKTYRQGKFPVRAGRDLHVPFNSNAVEETIALGEKLMRENLSELKSKPIIFFLRGELGVGKTHFTKGIAKALGIERTIKSPTYTYIEEYKVDSSWLIVDSKIQNTNSIHPSTIHHQPSTTLFHIDSWRIENKSDLETLGFFNWLKQGNILVIEWPDIALEFLEDKNLLNSAKIVNVDINDLGDERREILVY